MNKGLKIVLIILVIIICFLTGFIAGRSYKNYKIDKENMNENEIDIDVDDESEDKYGENEEAKENIDNNTNIAYTDDLVTFREYEIPSKDLSQKSLKWLEKYNELSDEDQLKVNSIPYDILQGIGVHVDSDLIAEEDFQKNEDALNAVINGKYDK